MVLCTKTYIIKVIGGPLYFGDGLELLSTNKVLVAGNPSGRLVESLDGWNTAFVVAKFSGPKHRLSTSPTVKDGKVYLNHMVGIGYPKKKHAIVETVLIHSTFHKYKQIWLKFGVPLVFYVWFCSIY
ncbi:calcium-dependent phosphotriesterase superfamily protein [Medicago truncatula]|uniref:Calcium-dependent phosphotriesterase superfamily protein n=1 Tax=Medicago truncatula TaxID=3880 RepID=G7JC49_MEDTR|nr:calcium-dependent phosphotriesterase superfamily protein [Medicago truncatula]